MNWIRIKTTEGKTVYLNVNEIIYMGYNEDVDLTEIVITRSGYATLFASGDITKGFSRMLSANNNSVTVLG